jgi:hypothetical protein
LPCVETWLTIEHLAGLQGLVPIDVAMEHLPLPRDPITGHPAIRLTTQQFDDPGPFLTYPGRHGELLRGNHPNVPSQADALAGRFAAAVGSPEILDYYQGWLYFCLLQEFLEDLYSFERYASVTVDKEGEIQRIDLCTTHLHDDLAAWRSIGRLASIRRGDEYHRHLDECLNVVGLVFDTMEDTFPGFMGLYSEDMLCLAALAEALDSAVTTAVQQGPLDDISEPLEDSAIIPSR